MPPTTGPGICIRYERVVIACLPDTLAAPVPTRAEVSAAEYHRPDDRFAPETDAARIALAQAHAAEQLSGTALVKASQLLGGM